MCVYMLVSVFVYVCIHTCECVCLFVYVCIHVSVFVCLCMCVYMLVSVFCLYVCSMNQSWLP